MLATSSFKDELARYDFELTNKTFLWSPEDRASPDPVLKRHLSHIQRWAKDPRAQEIWTKIKKSIPGVEAQHLIFLADRLRESVGLLAELTASRERMLARYRAQTAKLFLSKRPATEIAEGLERVVLFLRWLGDLEDRGVVLGDMDDWSTLWREGCLLPVDDLKISRKNQKGSRARKLFARQMGFIFYKLCGQWHDKEVAVLTEIAFPGKKLDVVDIQAMRRPTTTRERASK